VGKKCLCAVCVVSSSKQGGGGVTAGRTVTYVVNHIFKISML